MIRALTIFLLTPSLALGAVTYQSKGNFTSGTGTCTPSTTGASWAANDILFVVVNSENQTISLDTANSFVEIGAQASQASGTAATDPASRLAVYWKRATSSADSMPVVGDSGNNTECQLYVYRGAVVSGDPWDGTGVSTTTSGGTAPAGSSPAFPGPTTTQNGSLVVGFISTSYNATTSNAMCSGHTNAALTSITERGDETNTAGLGGGNCVWDATMATSGVVGNTTVTIAQTTRLGGYTLALKAEPAAACTPLLGYLGFFGCGGAAGGGGGSVSFDAVSGLSQDDRTTLSWSHTVGSGTNRALIVIAHNAGTQCSGTANSVSITGVTYGGTAMTSYGSYRLPSPGCNSGQAAEARVFYMTAPTSGAANVVVSGTDADGNACNANCSLHGMAVSVESAHQTTPIRGTAAHATGLSGSGTISNSITTVSGDFVIQYVTNGADTDNMSWGTGETQLGTWGLNGNTASNNHMGSYKAATTTSTTMSHTDDFDETTQLLVAVQPP